jgi:hypothetical protein
MKPTKEELVRQRLELRLKLMAAGVATARFDIAEENDSGCQSFRAQFAARDGQRIVNTELASNSLKVMVAWVDEHVPGWSKDDGGRSRIDWAVEVDAFQHQHFDNVRLERRRLLDAASDWNESTSIMADNARKALLVAMGDLAPTEAFALQHLSDRTRVVVDQTRKDRERFLSDQQRGMLIDGIAGTQIRHGNEVEWVADVVWNGHPGYFHASDRELVQLLVNEPLDEIVEGIVGPLRVTGGSDEEQRTRQALIEALTLPKSIEALRAAADDPGSDLLRSLPGVDDDEVDSASHDAPLP